MSASIATASAETDASNTAVWSGRASRDGKVVVRAQAQSAFPSVVFSPNNFNHMGHGPRPARPEMHVVATFVLPTIRSATGRIRGTFVLGGTALAALRKDRPVAIASSPFDQGSPAEAVVVTGIKVGCKGLSCGLGLGLCTGSSFGPGPCVAEGYELVQARTPPSSERVSGDAFVVPFAFGDFSESVPRTLHPVAVVELVARAETFMTSTASVALTLESVTYDSPGY